MTDTAVSKVEGMKVAGVHEDLLVLVEPGIHCVPAEPAPAPPPQLLDRAVVVGRGGIHRLAAARHALIVRLHGRSDDFEAASPASPLTGSAGLRGRLGFTHPLVGVPHAAADVQRCRGGARGEPADRSRASARALP